MSWLEDIASSVLDPKFLVPTVGAIWSNRQTNAANAGAANIAREGQAQNIRAIQAGQAASMGRLDAIAAEAQPATTYLRSVMGQDPNMLTQQQQQQMEEVRRQTLVGLNNSGLRGSARATTGAIRKIDSTTMGDMVAQNRARADAAAGTLAGRGQQAQVAAAAVPMNVAAAEGRGAIDTASTGANAMTANANTNASTLAAIAAYANRGDLERQVKERYKTVSTA